MTQRLGVAIFGTWALTSLILLLVCAPTIVGNRFPDPDDALRLLQVRDWIGGQSWWDVSQHRLAGGAMHWSRLVDLPIAAVELIVRPFCGALIAERVAQVVVPLGTLFVVLALVAMLARRLLDEERASWALLIAPLSMPLIYQMTPMRIDHHGWQVALALAALLALVTGRGARAGVVAGAMLALLLTVSLEGLPIAATLAGIAGLDWALRGERPELFRALGLTLFGTALALHLTTRGPLFWSPACDAVSPAWLACLGVGAVGACAAGLVRSPVLLPRFALLGATAGTALTTLLLVEPACLHGPFVALDPLVRLWWYDQVAEGLPVWRQTPLVMAAGVGLPLVGLIGGGVALRGSAPCDRRGWWIVLAASFAAFAVSLMVARAAATASAFALPGAALVVVSLLARARRVRAVPLRILATTGALIAAVPGLAAFPLLLFGPARAGGAALPVRATCRAFADVRGVTALPQSRLFAPLDIAPDLLATTRHSAIASGHHRNAAQMRDVIAVYTGAPAAGEAIVRRYRARYLIGCPGLNETELYAHRAPNGLWARLERGERVDWLEPVPIGDAPVLVWRVTPVHPRLPEPPVAR